MGSILSTPSVSNHSIKKYNFQYSSLLSHTDFLQEKCFTKSHNYHFLEYFHQNFYNLVEIDKNIRYLIEYGIFSSSAIYAYINYANDFLQYEELYYGQDTDTFCSFCGKTDNISTLSKNHKHRYHNFSYVDNYIDKQCSINISCYEQFDKACRLANLSNCYMELIYGYNRKYYNEHLNDKHLNNDILKYIVKLCIKLIMNEGKRNLFYMITLKRQKNFFLNTIFGE